MGWKKRGANSSCRGSNQQQLELETPREKSLELPGGHGAMVKLPDRSWDRTGITDTMEDST